MLDRNTEIHKTAEEARQGPLGRPVWLVLVTSTALVAAVFAVLWLTFASITEEPDAQPPAQMQEQSDKQAPRQPSSG